MDWMLYHRLPVLSLCLLLNYKQTGTAYLPPLQQSSKCWCKYRFFRTLIIANESPTYIVQLLHEKTVQHRQYTKRMPPPPFAEAWGALREELQSSGNQEESRLPLAGVALRKLKVPLTTEYATEKEFDHALFESLRDCLSACEMHQADQNAILLNFGSSQKYAIGIARQKSPAVNLVQLDDNSSINGAVTSTGMNVKSRLDHAVYLFERRANNRWSVTDCFSIVDLKLSSTSCKEFDVCDFTNTIDLVDFEIRHGALAQVIMHNFGCVLLYHAKRGVLDESIPLAMIAGKKQGDVGLNSLLGGNRRKRRAVLRWLSGRLEIPHACGGGFYYAIHDFGRFNNDSEDQSVEQALSLYIETILFGLVAAIKVQHKLEEGKASLAVPASGKCLMFGDATLNLPFCASPIPGTVVIQDTDHVDNSKVSQGELFKGRLNVAEVLHNSSITYVDFRHDKQQKIGPSDVVVKLSSHSVHNLLVSPLYAYLALLRLQRADKSLINQIGSVLLAARESKMGLLTIMQDLTKQGYGVLEPIHYCGQLALLWRGFQEVVEQVLLPMAELGIIHSDIRPGYDVTANILCRVKRDKFGDVKVTMKLIDYESLLYFIHWTVPYDGRYIRKEPDWDATTYLWWQCMAVAFTWKEMLYGTSLRTDGSLHRMKRVLLEDLSGPAWLEKFRDLSKGKITSEIVKLMLADMVTEFFDTPPPN